MELIEKALAKARAEGARGAAEPAQSESVSAPVPEPVAQPASAAPAATAPVPQPQPAPAAPASVPPGELGQIAYSQTQVSAASSAVWADNRLVAHLHNRNADLFRILRTKVLQEMRENNWRTLAVVGATSGVGKSTIASNLALSIALDSNQTVLLVDADLRKPRVATYFGLSPSKGLGDYLSADIPVQDLLINPGVERLVLLPATGSYSNSTELLGSRKMSTLVGELRSRYESRLVMFDLPPLLASGDALGFLPQFDCALLVVENGGNTAAQLKEATRLLEKTKLLGWVLNKADAGLGSYYYRHYGNSAYYAEKA
ncbi:MAG: CpsD/CapB family tyrosine-protein kinase [Gammaproteobacteria bacterium]